LQSFHSLEDEQKQRQLQDQERSRLAHLSNQRRLKEFKKESALAHGRVLFQTLHQAVAEQIRTSVEGFICDPTRARIHGAALPYLNEFDSLEQVAGVALITALDQMTRKQTLATFCQSIGKALEDENRLIRLRHRSPLTQRKLFRSSGLSRRAIASKQVMRALACPCPEWNDKAKLQVGSFMLDCMECTGLFRLVKRRVGNRTPYYVEPTEDVLAFIRACPPAVAATSHGAMVCPPRPWTGVFGGGLLDNPEPLVRVPVQDMEDRHGKAVEMYRQADMSRVLTAVNALQDTPLLVSGEMTSYLRTAWDNGIDGLFPCSRVPMEVPERLGHDPSLEALKERNRLAAMAHRDREKNRNTRVKVERAIQHAEALADRTIWQAYQLDHRGRAYTVNRYVTHQGPDYEKSLLTLPPEPVGPDGIDWILKAAAGHHGLSRSTWADRLQWGHVNRERMVAAAEDPLGRLELWRSAKDPWQFLQACRGLKEALETGSTGVPIRLDQTTSGLGILSAMTRQKGIARLCNVWGSTPRDLYSVVAERVTKALEHDMQLGEDDKQKALSSLWLNYGITRSLVKGPVLAVPYGGKFMSVSDMLVDVLDAHYGYVPLEEFNYKVATPAKYLASHLWRELMQVVEPCMVVKAWLLKVVGKVMNHGHPLEWTAPTGFPMRVADRMLTTTNVPMLLFGQRRSIKFADAPIEAKLNPQAAKKAICANVVHSMDASLLIGVTNAMAQLGAPLLTNHDCFATTPLHATALHDRLLWNFAGLYRTDWLAVWKEEIETGTGLKLPKLPQYGDLEVGLIGSNPYVFS
jgi:DNA-directed RNA polymerase